MEYWLNAKAPLFKGELKAVEYEQARHYKYV
jgi:hypothetical protein